METLYFIPKRELISTMIRQRLEYAGVIEGGGNGLAWLGKEEALSTMEMIVTP